MHPVIPGPNISLEIANPTTIGSTHQQPVVVSPKHHDAEFGNVRGYSPSSYTGKSGEIRETRRGSNMVLAGGINEQTEHVSSSDVDFILRYLDRHSIMHLLIR